MEKKILVEKCCPLWRWTPLFRLGNVALALNSLIQCNHPPTKQPTRPEPTELYLGKRLNSQPASATDDQLKWCIYTSQAIMCLFSRSVGFISWWIWLMAVMMRQQAEDNLARNTYLPRTFILDLSKMRVPNNFFTIAITIALRNESFAITLARLGK